MPRHSRSTGPERQARLKPQFASLYPDVVAGEWVPAWLLAEQLMRSAERRRQPHRRPGVRSGALRVPRRRPSSAGAARTQDAGCG